MVKREDYKD